MLLPELPPVSLPDSYAQLDLQHVRCFHVPESSSTPTQVLLVKLWRPGKNNAFTGQMQQDLERIYRCVDVDDRVKCVVLAGEGRMFCAGADLELGFLGGTTKAGATRTPKHERDVDHRDGGGRVSLAIHQCSKPTIAAIQGSAVGVGITMVLPAAIKVVYAKAKIGFVFSRRGIIMEAASHYFLPKLIGFSRALHLTTTGSVYPADHPLLRELFSETLPTPEATLSRALELASEVAANTSSLSTKLMRDLMFRGPDSAEAAHLLDSRVIHSLFGSSDNNEGVRSFFEKRPPNFTASMNTDAPESWPWWTPVDINHRISPQAKGSKL